MEGLIKGLLDVALGGHHEDDRGGRREEDREGHREEDREDRSRSTWSEVVSGDDGDQRENGDNRRPPLRNSRNDQYDQGGRDEEWEAAGSRRPLPRKDVDEGYRRHEDEGRQGHGKNRWNREEERLEGKDDGWETVGGRKPQRQPHKVPTDQWNQYKKHPSEQEYAEDFQGSGSLEPSREELNDLSQACNKLWELDCNRLLPGKDYEIDCGEGKKVYQREDMAQGSLFRWLNEDVFRRPTISRFFSLLDNYNPNQGSKEVVTAEETQEQAAFIEEISRTAPIKYLHKYLAAKRIVSGDFNDFKRRLKSLWFDLYGRGGTSGCSSAFEHVFVGEIKQRGEQEVSGFHNWLQFYSEEAKGRVDYQGYIFPRRRGQIPDSETQLLTLQFEWNGVLKSVSSTLVGVSPEFEVALYTLCYYAGEEDNHVELGPYPVNIKCYRLGERIGSVFPIAES